MKIKMVGTGLGSSPRNRACHHLVKRNKDLAKDLLLGLQGKKDMDKFDKKKSRNKVESAQETLSVAIVRYFYRIRKKVSSEAILKRNPGRILSHLKSIFAHF